MTYVLSTAQMREAETRVIEKLGISSAILMETAGKACADHLISEKLVRPNQAVLVLCGTGNNGGDGAVIARWLAHYGIPVALALIGEGELSPDMAHNLSIYEKLDLPHIQVSNLEDLEELRKVPLPHRVIIDAVFGTGFHGKLSKFHRELFDYFNNLAVMRISIDIASGLNGDTGYGQGYFQSDLTLVIGSYKYGNLLGFGNTGLLEQPVIDIGIPQEFLDDLQPARLIDADYVDYPDRFPNAHKGMYGEVMVLAGSPGMAGAAILASKAALKTGAGYVRLYAHPQVAAAYIGAHPELLIETVPLNSEGGVDATALRSQIHDPSVILIGPGIGTGAYGRFLLDFALSHKGIPLVLDADALKLLARNPELMFLLKNREVLLTPHLGELSELASVSMDDIRSDPLKHLKDYVKKYKLPVLLKSSTSVYADQYQTVFNISGNDGLATGGSGDVLAGIIASFLAQGSTLPDSATAASYLMGKTAERLSEKWETPAITPLMIIEHLFELGEEE